MTDIEPIEPYVYQPEPVNSPLAPRLWTVAGPGAEGFDGIRLTKEHANKLAGLLKFRREAMTALYALPELNMSNYTEDEVSELNCGVSNIVKTAIESGRFKP